MNKEEIKELKAALKESRKDAEVPLEENMLEWSIPELNAYIKEKTRGMNIRKKLKFAKELNKKIIDAKKKAKS